MSLSLVSVIIINCFSVTRSKEAVPIEGTTIIDTNTPSPRIDVGPEVSYVHTISLATSNMVLKNCPYQINAEVGVNVLVCYQIKNNSPVITLVNSINNYTWVYDGGCVFVDSKKLIFNYNYFISGRTITFTSSYYLRVCTADIYQSETYIIYTNTFTV